MGLCLENLELLQLLRNGNKGVDKPRKCGRNGGKPMEKQRKTGPREETLFCIWQYRKLVIASAAVFWDNGAGTAGCTGSWSPARPVVPGSVIEAFPITIAETFSVRLAPYACTDIIDAASAAVIIVAATAVITAAAIAATSTIAVASTAAPIIPPATTTTTSTKSKTTHIFALSFFYWFVLYHMGRSDKV